MTRALPNWINAGTITRRITSRIAAKLRAAGEEIQDAAARLQAGAHDLGTAEADADQAGQCQAQDRRFEEEAPPTVGDSERRAAAGEGYEGCRPQQQGDEETAVHSDGAGRALACFAYTVAGVRPTSSMMPSPRIPAGGAAAEMADLAPHAPAISAAPPVNRDHGATACAMTRAILERTPCRTNRA